MEDTHIRSYPGQLLIKGIHSALTSIFFLILASVVAPSEFGSIALVAVGLAFGNLITEFGLEQALIQEPDLSSSQLSSSLWVALGISAGFVIFVQLLAPGMGWLFSDPSLEDLLRVCMLALPATATTVVPRAVMLRAHRFRQVAVSDLAAIIAAFAVGGWLLAIGYGVFSFMVFVMTYSHIRMALAFTFSKWAPGMTLNVRELKPVLRTGWNLQTAGILNLLGKQVDTLLIARFLGSAQLGLYSFSYRIISLVQDVVFGPLRQMALPVYSQMQQEKTTLYQMMCRDTKAAVTGLLPILAMLGTIGHWVIPGIFGPEWANAAVLFGLFCAEAGRQAMTGLVPTTITASGRADLLRTYAVVSLPALVIAYFAGLSWGVFGVALSFICVNTLLNIFLMILFRKAIGESLGSLVFQWIPGLFASAVATGSIMGIQAFTGGGVHGGLVALGGSIIVTTAVVKLMFPESWRLCKTMVEAFLGLHSGQTHRPVIVFVDPLINEGNPHLSILHRGILSSKTVDLRPLKFGLFVLTLPWKRLSELRRVRLVVHLHFVNRFYESKHRFVVIFRFVKLLMAILWCRLFFVRIAWTFHDDAAHDFRYRAVEKIFLYWLVQLCDVILTLSERGRSILWARYGRTESIVFTPHPPYDGVYPNSISRSAAKKRLRIPGPTRVYLFLGRLMPYKGLEELIGVFREWKPKVPTRLIIAGAPRTPGFGATLERLANHDKRIELRPEFISNENIALLTSAADYGVLPYRRILHSGTAMLFFTLGCPIIVPKLGWFPEIFRIHKVGLLYDGDQNALHEVLERSLDIDRESFNDGIRSLNVKWSLDQAVELTIAAYRRA